MRPDYSNKLTSFIRRETVLAFSQSNIISLSSNRKVLFPHWIIEFLMTSPTLRSNADKIIGSRWEKADLQIDVLSKG